MASVIALFVVGGLLLATVDERRGGTRRLGQLVALHEVGSAHARQGVQRAVGTHLQVEEIAAGPGEGIDGVVVVRIEPADPAVDVVPEDSPLFVTVNVWNAVASGAPPPTGTTCLGTSPRSMVVASEPGHDAVGLTRVRMPFSFANYAFTNEEPTCVAC